METIKFNHDGIEYEFRAATTVMDDLKINQEAESLLGGSGKLNEIENILTESLSKSAEIAKAQIGADRYEQIIEEERNETITEEDEQLLIKLRSNSHYRTFVRFALNRQFVFDLAWLKIMCVKPKTADFYGLSTEKVNFIIEEVKKARVFFRPEAQSV